MTKQESINKYLREIGEGGCWHEGTINKWYECKKCGYESDQVDIFNVERCNPNFSDPANFIRLLKIAERKEIKIEINTSFSDIMVKKQSVKFHEYRHYLSSDEVPSTLSELIAKALGWKEGTIGEDIAYLINPETKENRNESQRED